MSAAFEDNVFINCPFDGAYQPLFQAVIFAIHDAGFVARCALEVNDSAQNRLQKIMDIIAECKYAIHDISRIELDKTSQLPRFNMPLELGIDLGCRQFGRARQRSKQCLILDSEPYRYQKFLSDIAGQDIGTHGNSPEECIKRIREFVATASKRKAIPGGTVIARRFERFGAQLPDLCQEGQIELAELTFLDWSNFITEWLKQHPLKNEP